MSLLQDIRYGARVLASKPGVTAAAVLSLALGVGANSAVFSLIDALLLKGLPGVESPEELVILGEGSDRGMSVSTDPVVGMFSYPRFERLRDGSSSLAGLAAIVSSDARVYVRRSGDATPTSAFARAVSGEYFGLLGVRPSRGRLLGEDDNRTPSGHAVAVLDYGYWQEHFGANEDVVGSSLIVNDHPFTIVGVAPEGFAGERLGQRPDIYAPVMMEAEISRGDFHLERSEVSFLHLLGRLAPGATREQAETELATLWRTMLEEEGGENPSEEWVRGIERERMTVRSGASGYAGAGNLTQPLWLLLGVTALVLLIACANVANLLLARGAARTREMSVRVALGADRGRLFRQMLVESLMLAGIAGATAVLVAMWSRDALIAMTSTDAAALSLERMDWRILAFTGGVALATGLLFGLAPAWRAGRMGIASAMRGGRGSVGGGGKLRTALVVGQAAMSLLLLFGAGLFLNSLTKLAEADVGFARESLLSVVVDARGAGMEEDRQPIFARRLLEAAEAVPGVRSASMSAMQVVSYGTYSSTMEIPGYESTPDEDMDARMFYVTPGFLETVGTPLVRGRGFSVEDAEGAQLVAVIDQVFAKRFFGETDPVGRMIGTGPDEEARIVGVAATAKMNHVRETPMPSVYLSAYTRPIFLRALTVRAEGEPAELGPAIRKAIAEVEPSLPINAVTTIEERLEQQSSADRMLLQLISGFGVLALLLAAVGLYGVLSYRVAGRTSEIGLRMAVGADRGDVLGLVMKEGLLLAGGGVLLGLVIAPFAAGPIESLLYQPEGWNPAALATAAGVLLAVAALAALAPSLRAARMNPVTALREE